MHLVVIRQVCDGQGGCIDGGELAHVVGGFAHVIGVFADHGEVAGVFLVLLHELDIAVKKRFVAVHRFLEGRRLLLILIPVCSRFFFGASVGFP